MIVETRLLAQSVTLFSSLVILAHSTLPVYAHPYRAAIKVIPTFVRMLRLRATLEQNSGSPSQPTYQERYPEFNEVWVRNSTNDTIWLVVHYWGESSWTTEGWIEIPPREVVPIAATDNRYIFFYAENDQGVFWGGDTPVQVCSCAMYPDSPSPYGEYYTEYFFEEDLGAQFSSHTINLY